MRPSFAASHRPLSLCVVLLGLCAVAGCSRVPDPPSKPAGAVATTRTETTALPKPPPAKYQRDLYARLEDCVADWAFAGKCTSVGADAPERARGAAFMGPIYSNSLRSEAQLATRREAFDLGYVPQVDESPSNKALAASEVRS